MRHCQLFPFEPAFRVGPHDNRCVEISLPCLDLVRVFSHEVLLCLYCASLGICTLVPRVMRAQSVRSGAGESLRYMCGERRSSNLLKDSKAVNKCLDRRLPSLQLTVHAFSRCRPSTIHLIWPILCVQSYGLLGPTVLKFKKKKLNGRERDASSHYTCQTNTELGLNTLGGAGVATLRRRPRSAHLLAAPF